MAISSPSIPSPEEADRSPASRKGPQGARPRAELPDYLPARMVNEFVYCPRLFFYEWVEGLFAHSADTVEGALRHEKLETKADALPAPGSDEAIHSRSVELSSETHKLIAKIDLVEGEGGRVSAVEYKRGAPRQGEEGPEAWPADRAQVCVQVLVLRDNGYACDEAVVYYNLSKQRVRVAIDDALVAETLAAVASARLLASRGRIPEPLVDSPKCARCSLVSICLPDETHAASRLRQESAGAAQLSLFDLGEERLGEALAPPAEVRRLLPARDDLRPLYVTGNGLSIGKTREVLQVREKGKVVQEARLGEISQLSVFGNAQLTSAAVQGMCWAEKPIAHFSYGGWFYGLTTGLGLKNVFLRRAQFRRADDESFCLRSARQLMASKIRNQRTLLQRNHIEPPRAVLVRLKALALQVEAAPDLESLLGLEGLAARLYFESFGGMIKVEGAAESAAMSFDFTGRNRRPPRDPVNALLSFAYALLAKDLTIVCHAVGFDPFIGFYHRLRFGRPALALDLMEGFRPLIADSAVLTAINTRMLEGGDFLRVGDAVALKPHGRKAFLHAYEQRMDTLVTHPLFGYRVSYRRVLEIQARLLARVVSGELSAYPGFETR